MSRPLALILAMATLMCACQSPAPSATQSPSADPSPTATATPSPSVVPSSPPAASPSSEPSSTPTPSLGDRRINVLFVGSDNSRLRRASALTDSLIVVSLDPVGKSVSLLGLPRDLTDFPLPNGQTYRRKVNSIYSEIRRDPTRFGGRKGDDPYEVLAGVIGNLVDLPIDHYVTVDMDGFVELIDALGGVDVYVDDAVCDPTYRHAGVRGLEARRGWWHVTGPQALALARVRHDTGGSDFQRMRRQQDLLVAIYERALEKGVDGDPLTWLGKIPRLRTDLPPETVLAAAAVMTQIPPDRFRSRRIQPFGRGGEEVYDGRGYVLRAKMNEIRETSRALFTKPGRVPSTGRREALPDKPSRVRSLPRFNGC